MIIVSTVEALALTKRKKVKMKNIFFIDER